jgi:DNA gyrase subunit A
MISCKSGVTIRMKVADISEQGRATQGVKLIRIDEGDEIAAITKLDVEEVEEKIDAEANGEGDNGEQNGLTAAENPNEAGEITDTTNSPENTSEGEETAPSA